MKAVAVTPGTPNSAHLAELPRPTIDSVPPGLKIRPGHGVLVRMLKVGVDATDKEINEALYGNAPPGSDFLVLGHESFGVVEEVGPRVRGIKPGDYVTATVRRPGGSIYDQIGTYDMTSEETYYERGINLLHGFLTEYVVDDEEYIVRVPPGLKHLHVLMEPMSCAAKAVQQAFEVQRRMRVWRPRIAYVMGAGQIGLLATLILRLRGLEVYTMARSKPPTLNSEIVEGMEAHYVSLSETKLADLAARVGKADLIVDATGNSRVAFDSMKVLGHNGVLVWTSITGGIEQHEVPSDKINIDWVLGNKLLLGSVNANREHFESGIKDLALGEVMYPGVIQRILTNEIVGLDNYQEMMRLLVEERSALKVFMTVAEE
ncbi:MAG: glucose 1-dehydrogenase [Pirellulaceae bacterium]|nr:glucose 1-dehydrogenase [Planctomycetales bacterium]MCA9219749.1 glucose 1-dehydrogenase [Planctomycetales bacterium]MCA9226628.1 glucose 1-dehydrogenase [Planctomycetales bacterium]